MDEKLWIDKTELVFRDMSSGREVMRNLPYSAVTTIQVGTKIVRKFFGLIKTTTDVIQIKAVGVTNPLEILRSEEGDERYERYLEGLKKFAHDNHVTMRINGPEEKPLNAKEEWDGKK